MAPGELKILAWVVTDLQKKNGLNPPKEIFLALYCQSTMRWINFLRGINIWQLFRIIDATSDINSTQKVDESKNAWNFSSEVLRDFKILFFWGIKGHLISKENCQAVNSFKKRSLLCDLFSFIFWKKLKSTKRNFEINWPLPL